MTPDEVITQEQLNAAWADLTMLPLLIAEKRREIRQLENRLREAEDVTRRAREQANQETNA